MGQKRHTPEEIVAKLRQMDVLVAPGTPVADAIRTIGMTEVGREMNCWMGRSFTPCSRAGFPYLDAPVRITIRRLVADSGSHTSPTRPRIWRTSAPFSDIG